MSKQFVSMVAEIVIANSMGKGFTTDQITQMLSSVADTLKELEAGSGEILAVMRPFPETKAPADWKSSIGKDTITCLICGHSGKVLTPHLKSKHKITPKEYRKQFAIPAGTPLVSKAYRAKRIKMAKDSGSGDRLKKAREVKKLKV